jgi:hypothetical protein
MLGFLILAVVAGIGFARNSNSGFDPDGLEELEKQKGQFKTTLIRPDADFSKYGKLCPKRVLLQFRGPGPPQEESTMGSLVKKKSREVVVPEGEELEVFRQVIADAFTAEMGSCELFELVEDAGPGTLLFRVMVTEIMTDIAEKSSKEKPFSVQGNFLIDVVDAETGIIQARFGEFSRSKKVKNPVEVPGAGAQWVSISSWAGKAATEFRQELERIRHEG